MLTEGITAGVFIVTLVSIKLILKFIIKPKAITQTDHTLAIPSRREALESAKVAWGLWHTGTRMRIDLLLEVKSLRRVLLLEPNAQNPSLGYISTKSKNPVDWIIGEIMATTKVALDNGIDVRWYFTARESALTIYDPTPVGDKPCSENAWMYVEYFTPSVGVDQRKGHIIHNSGKDKNRFMGYYKEYEDIWNDSNKSTQAEQTLEVVAYEAQETEKILVHLAELRTCGVSIRNEGMALDEENKLEPWIKKVDDWTKNVIDEIGQISKPDAEYFKTLNWVPAINFSRLILNPEHLKTLREHNERIERLEKLYQKYNQQGNFKQ